MAVGRRGLGKFRDVHHAVVHRRVLKYLPVRSGERERLALSQLTGHETVGVEIALIHHKEVDSHKHRKQRAHGRHLDLAENEHVQDASAESDKYETTERIGRNHRHSHGLRGGEYRRIRSLGEVCPVGVALLLRQERPEHRRRHNAQKTDEQAYPERDKHRPAVTLRIAASVNQSLHCKYGKQGNGKLRHHEYARHRAELIVHREVVDHQVGEPHHVMSPRQCYRNHGHGHKHPLHGAFDYDASEQEQGKHQSPHIYRAVGHWLVAEILGKLAQGFGHVALQLARIHHIAGRVDIVESEEFVGTLFGLYGRTALHVGNQQCESLVLAVAPGRDVILVQTAALACRTVSLEYS